MHVEINMSSPQLIHRQIVEQIRCGVARDALSAGEALPSVRELAQRHPGNPGSSELRAALAGPFLRRLDTVGSQDRECGSSWHLTGGLR